MLYFDPLEQFSIEIYSRCLSEKVSLLPYNSIGIVFTFISFLVIIFIYSAKSIFLLNKLQKVIISIFLFVLSILKDSLTIKKYSFILLFYTTFLFIFISNVIGMIPYSITITSRIFVKLIFISVFTEKN
jgi:F-type H+-transporting ATPase subunit a